jgi:hypothetical protein
VDDAKHRENARESDERDLVTKIVGDFVLICSEEVIELRSGA